VREEKRLVLAALDGDVKIVCVRRWRWGTDGERSRAKRVRVWA
jgi:hypothetical protein